MDANPKHLWSEILFRLTEGMLTRDKKTFHFAVSVLVQIKNIIGLEGWESEQQARWNAENGQKEPETIPGTGDL